MFVFLFRKKTPKNFGSFFNKHLSTVTQYFERCLSCPSIPNILLSSNSNNVTQKYAKKTIRYTVVLDCTLVLGFLYFYQSFNFDYYYCLRLKKNVWIVRAVPRIRIVNRCCLSGPQPSYPSLPSMPRFITFYYFLHRRL